MYPPTQIHRSTNNNLDVNELCCSEQSLFSSVHIRVIEPKSGHYAHYHILLLTNFKQYLKYIGHIKLKEKIFLNKNSPTKECMLS